MGAVEFGYPPTGQVQPAIPPSYKYHETEMDGLCKTSQDQQESIEARQEADEVIGGTARIPQSNWQRQMLVQGPWDEINDPDFVEAFKSEAKFRQPKSLSQLEGCDIPKSLSDLENIGCGRHVLIENNMIGLAGAAALGHWTLNNPGNIETWFLAGNSIDVKTLQTLVGAWIFADNITNIWLRRNPLGPESAYMLSILIKNSPKLRTLDLDQTELGDPGVADLFGALLPLQTEKVLKVRTPVPASNGDSGLLYRVVSLNPIWIKKRAWGEESPLRAMRPLTTITSMDSLTSQPLPSEIFT